MNVPTGLWLAKMPSPATTWKWYSVPARTSMRATNDGWPPTSSDMIEEALSISGGVPSDCQKLTSDGTAPATRYATKATFPALASTDRTVISGPRSTWRIGGGLSKTAGTPSGQPSGGGVRSQTVRNGTRSTSAMSTGVTIGGSPIVPGIGRRLVAGLLALGQARAARDGRRRGAGLGRRLRAAAEQRDVGVDRHRRDAARREGPRGDDLVVAAEPERERLERVGRPPAAPVRAASQRIDDVVRGRACRNRPGRSRRCRRRAGTTRASGASAGAAAARSCPGRRRRRRPAGSPGTSGR